MRALSDVAPPDNLQAKTLLSDLRLNNAVVLECRSFGRGKRAYTTARLIAGLVYRNLARA